MYKSQLFLSIFRIVLLLHVSLISNVAIAAKYRIKFTGTWSEADVVSEYPLSAHFSPMVGATHQQGFQFWENGGRASLGVERVAELGVNAALLSEIADARANGTGGVGVEFSSLFSLPNSDTIEINVEEDKPYITLISMIAPSPDWFVGVSGLSLISQDEWVQTLRVELRPYDAGTEQGDTFSLGNPSSPATERISRLSGSDSPFIGRPVIGTLEFTLLSSPVVEDPPTPRIPGSGEFLPAVTGLLLSD